jgi:hypothetical protein
MTAGCRSVFHLCFFQLGALPQADQALLGVLEGAYQLVEFLLNFPVLRVLNEKHQQRGDDRRADIAHKLRNVRRMTK